MQLVQRLPGDAAGPTGDADGTRAWVAAVLDGASRCLRSSRTNTAHTDIHVGLTPSGFNASGFMQGMACLASSPRRQLAVPCCNTLQQSCRS